MPPLAAAPIKTASWPIKVGAEGIVAAQFARCGFDVLVQSGYDKPWYDLTVTKAGNLLKVAVKGSDDGRWQLAESYLRRASHLHGKKPDFKGVVDLWLDIHGPRTVYCLVQFEGVPLQQLPRIYMASPADIALKLHESAERLGEPILCEDYEWTSAETGCTAIETLPSSWLFSQERIDQLLFPQPAEAIPMPLARKTPATIELRPKAVDLVGAPMREAVMTA